MIWAYYRYTMMLLDDGTYPARLKTKTTPPAEYPNDLQH